MADPIPQLLTQLDALTGGLFLLAAFGLVSTRQIQTCLRLFVLNSLLLAVAAALLAVALRSPHLAAVVAITIVTKAMMIPWLLRRTLRREVYSQREIKQALNIPTSLLIAATLTLFAYAVAEPLVAAVPQAFTRINLPIGIAGLLVGAFTVTVRREALPQLLGVLAMENGVFFAAVSIVPNLPVIAELAAAFDVPVITLVTSLLVRRIHDRMGTTSVGLLAALRED